jgi:hypothetical protein
MANYKNHPIHGTTKYEDSAEGAKKALADMSIHKAEHIQKAIPDPHVKGTWKVGVNHPKHGSSTHIVYLAGHGTHKHDDFETVNEAVEDETKKYYEPKAPAEKAFWMQHKIKKYTQAGIPDDQFSGKTQKDKSRSADQDAKPDNNPLAVIGMVELPAYMNTIKKAFTGLREDVLDESSVFAKMAAENRAKAKAKREADKAWVKNTAAKMKAAHKEKQANLHLHVAHHIAAEVGNHYPDSDGYDAIVHRLKKHHGIHEYDAIDHMNAAAKKHLGAKSFSDYVDQVHHDYTRDNPKNEEFVQSLAELIESLNEAFPPKKKEPKEEPEEDDENEDQDDTENQDEQPEDQDENDDTEEKDEDDQEDDSDQQNVDSGISGSEIKPQLETIALQAAEVFAEIDETGAFDSEIKDAIESATEAIGLIASKILNANKDSTDKNPEKKKDDAQPKNPQDLEGGNPDNQKNFQKEDRRGDYMIHTQKTPAGPMTFVNHKDKQIGAIALGYPTHVALHYGTRAKKSFNQDRISGSAHESAVQHIIRTHEKTLKESIEINEISKELVGRYLKKSNKFMDDFQKAPEFSVHPNDYAKYDRRVKGSRIADKRKAS